MATVKYAISAYVADGTTTDYLITWDYLDEDHIAVYVDGTSNADPDANHTFTKLNSTTVRVTDGLGGAIAAGAEIEIRRETPLQNRAITFADGSALLAEDLNKNSDYLLYSMQEVLDTVESAAQDGALQAQAEAELNRDQTIALKNTTAGYLATVQADEQAADAHRIAAAASEAAALVSENAAEASEIAAAASETAAAASEAAAAASETAAQAAETGAIAAQTGVFAAQTASEAARDAAQTAQTAAETAETNAKASETAAAASQVAAQSSESSAFADAATASTKATQASNSEVSANNSRVAAAASEVAAASSQVAAAASEVNASASEGAAANSAAAALTSKNQAAASQIAAASSETAAATHASNAEAAWDHLDDRYLGGMATGPATDNDGNAIVEGAIYWNTTDNKIYVWSGSSWSSTISGLATVATTGSFTDLTNQPAPFDPTTLATVATTGNYSDLNNIPPATASSIVQYASNPSNASDGDIYFNTTEGILRVFSSGAWGDIGNVPPVPQGGTITLNVSNTSESAFTFDLGSAFTDNATPVADMIYEVVSGSSLPAGVSISGPTLSHDQATWSSGSAQTYTFSITATDADGATSTPQNFSMVIPLPPTPKINYIPDFSSPSINLTSSGTISVPSNRSGSDIAYVYLVGSGGGSNSSLYQGGWYFGGLGGSARMIICTCDELDGASVAIAAGGSPSGSWRAKHGVQNFVTIGGVQYGTSHAASQQIVIHKAGTIAYDVPNGLTTTGFSISSGPVSSQASLTIDSNANYWGDGTDDEALHPRGGNSTQQRFNGGMGWAEYGGTGYQTSVYAGNGGASRGAVGGQPGGGAGYQASGGKGSCRVYFN